MNSSAANLVRRISQFLGAGTPQWNGSSRRLASEYVELVDQLCQRFNLAQLQMELEDFEEARNALHEPSSLLVETRELQFPRRLEWEKLIRSHQGPFRKLITPDEILQLEMKLRGHSAPGNGKRSPIRNDGILSRIPEDPGQAAKAFALEAGFAQGKSPAWIKMIPLVGAILVIGLGLLILAIFGSGFHKKPTVEKEGEPLTPEQLADLKNKKDQAKPIPGEVAFADKNKQANGANKEKEDQSGNGGELLKPVRRAPVEKQPLVDVPNPANAKDKTPAQVALEMAGQEMAGQKMAADKLGEGKNQEQGKPAPKAEIPLAPGMVRSPEIAKLDALITQYTQPDSASKLKGWLKLEKDTANKAALDGLLFFIRSDVGLLGRKPPLEWKDLPVEISSGRTLNTSYKDLFKADKLKRMIHSGKQGEHELSDWFNTVIRSDMKALQFFSESPHVVFPESIFSCAANIDLVDEFTRFIDKKILEYEGDKPVKVNGYIVALLREKRDLRDRSTENFLADIVAIQTELKRRVRTARYPWKNEAK